MKIVAYQDANQQANNLLLTELFHEGATEIELCQTLDNQ